MRGCDTISAMKTLSVILAVLLLASPVVPAQAIEGNQVTTLQVPGMTPGTQVRVEKTLQALPGVAQVKASAEIKAVVVVYDPMKVQSEQLIDAVKQAGFLATFAKANYRCPKCKASYEKKGSCIVDGAALEPVVKG